MKHLLLISIALALNAQQPAANPGSTATPAPPQTLEKPAKTVTQDTLSFGVLTKDSLVVDLRPSAFALYGESGKLTLSISREGKVTFGEGITPDEAARQFAAAMERYGLRMCTPAKPEASAKDAAKE